MATNMTRGMTPEDLDRIAQAVAEAEKTTAGEIFCVLAPEVSDYRETPLVWAAATALVLPAAALFAGFRPEMLTRLFGGWSVGHAAAMDGAILSALSTYIALQAVVFVLAALVVSIPSVRRALTPGALKAARVKKAAMEQFLGHGLHVLFNRTGVLIFAALAEHRVEAIADGFVAAVRRAGAILAEHVPPRSDNRDELANGLTILPKR